MVAGNPLWVRANSRVRVLCTYVGAPLRSPDHDPSRESDQHFKSRIDMDQLSNPIVVFPDLHSSDAVANAWNIVDKTFTLNP